MLGRILCLVIFCFTTVSCHADEVLTIPLDKIWAYNMPGTKDVRDLEPTKFGTRVTKLAGPQRSRLANESFTYQILESLPHLPSHKTARPKAGFAVQGKQEAVLHGAHGVLYGNLQPTHVFPTGDDINVVFFAHSSGSYVHLKNIQRENDRVQVAYQFMWHPQLVMTTHFALIPLGNLPSGTYTVDFVQRPDKPIANAIERPVRVSSEQAHRVVCDSFTFGVKKSAASK